VTLQEVTRGDRVKEKCEAKGGVGIETSTIEYFKHGRDPREVSLKDRSGYPKPDGSYEAAVDDPTEHSQEALIRRLVDSLNLVESHRLPRTGLFEGYTDAQSHGAEGNMLQQRMWDCQAVDSSPIESFQLLDRVRNAHETTQKDEERVRYAEEIQRQHTGWPKGYGGQVHASQTSYVGYGHYGATYAGTSCDSVGTNYHPMHYQPGLISPNLSLPSHVSSQEGVLPSFVPGTQVLGGMPLWGQQREGNETNGAHAHDSRQADRTFVDTSNDLTGMVEECLVGIEGEYQPYCQQIISLELNAAAQRVLHALKTLQNFDGPSGSKKRYFCSLKEVSKVAKHCKLLIIAPDVKPSPTAHIKPVKLLQSVINSAESAGVPYIFALSRRGIGQVFGRDKSMSIVAVMNLDQIEVDCAIMAEEARRGRRSFTETRNLS
jgi:ribosomal protein L7Ae-like RNA K-turn-binding protein